MDGAAWPPDLRTWWTPPAFESLHAAPELQEIVAAHFRDAVRWGNDRHQEHGATKQGSVGALFETKLVSSMPALGNTSHLVEFCWSQPCRRTHRLCWSRRR